VEERPALIRASRVQREAEELALLGMGVAEFDDEEALLGIT